MLEIALDVGHGLDRSRRANFEFPIRPHPSRGPRPRRGERPHDRTAEEPRRAGDQDGHSRGRASAINLRAARRSSSGWASEVGIPPVWGVENALGPSAADCRRATAPSRRRPARPPPGGPTQASTSACSSTRRPRDVLTKNDPAASAETPVTDHLFRLGGNRVWRDTQSEDPSSVSIRVRTPSARSCSASSRWGFVYRTSTPNPCS